MKMQSPKEFLFTYTWIFLAVLMVAILGIGALLFWPQAQAVQHSCSIVSGFTCASAALGTYSKGSVLFVRITNNLGAEISLASNSVIARQPIGNVTYTGICSPTVVQDKGSFICTVYMDGYRPQYGTIADPGFSVNYSVCNGACSKVASYIVSGTTYITAGLTLIQASEITSGS